LILPVWINFHELVIPGGIIFLGWISCPWAGMSLRKPHSSGGFLVYEEFPAESLFIPWKASVGSPRTKNPPDGNKSRIPYSEGSLLHKHNFLKFKHKNIIKKKNKHDPALLRP
jgi:hypothetical protein